MANKRRFETTFETMWNKGGRSKLVCKMVCQCMKVPETLCGACLVHHSTFFMEYVGIPARHWNGTIEVDAVKTEQMEMCAVDCV